MAPFPLSFSLAFAATAASSDIERTWMATEDPPEVRAQKLLEQMNLTEKLHLLKGNNTMKPYVGAVTGNDRLGIPALTLNDAGQGFRDNAGHPGTSTAFPSALSMSATWDPELARLFGVTMGEEFLAKGSNVQLGPGVCVSRVPYNGRNFEYMSGEDPFLGYSLAPPAVQGIQSTGVIANAKHFVTNSQETDRGNQSAEVDERTLHEIYYPPFEGMVQAGLGSVMCSYNKPNHKWSCENPKILGDLKDKLGFDGWVMSDWGATHSASIMEGLDQEMPGGSKMTGEPDEQGVCRHDLCRLIQNGTVTEDIVDRSALRILKPMFRMGLFDREASGSIDANVTSPEHNAVARKLAAASMVLLKNADDLLPLSSDISTVAVIGKAAKDPQVAGGGSGQVAAPYKSAPLDSIRQRFGIPEAQDCVPKLERRSCDGNPEFPDTDINGHDIVLPPPKVSDTSECCTLCSQQEGCKAYSFYRGDGTCYLKSQSTGRSAKKGQDTGLARGGSGSQQCVHYDDGRNSDSAAQMASKADVALVFAETKSGEGKDRENLSLYDGWNGDKGTFSYDKLIDAVADECAKSGTPVVVVMVSPGAVLTPWRGKVQGAIAAFMPGQEYGNAISDILWGDVSPSARLPITFPDHENQWGFTEHQWPGVDYVSTYSEKLEVGYRYYDAHNLEPAYPFGHGLSYASFSYSKLEATSSGVSFTVTNTGQRAGVEVPQLYLGFPSSAGEPPKQLKGFKQVAVGVGETASVSLPLSDRAFSIWDEKADDWVVQTGTFTAYVGRSSRDVQLTGHFEVSGHGVTMLV